jgi:ubiquinone/menaquinone biosynthesis C-methylase UbiE
MASQHTDLQRPRFARMYERVTPGMEAKGMGVLRDELLRGVAGAVVEVGAGNGMNFSHYPATTTQVTAIEAEPHLRSLAEKAAERSAVAIDVVSGRAERLPLDDASVAVGVVAIGFRVGRSRRLRFPESPIPVPAAPHVLGVARRPPQPPTPDWPQAGG